MLGDRSHMYWEGISPQNTGPFRVHDAFMEGALLDLQSRLARTLVTVTAVLNTRTVSSENGGPSFELELELQIQSSIAVNAIGPAFSTSPASPATTTLDATPLQAFCGDSIH